MYVDILLWAYSKHEIVNQIFTLFATTCRNLLFFTSEILFSRLAGFNEIKRRFRYPVHARRYSILNIV